MRIIDLSIGRLFENSALTILGTLAIFIRQVRGN